MQERSRGEERRPASRNRATSRQQGKMRLPRPAPFNGANGGSLQLDRVGGRADRQTDRPPTARDIPHAPRLCMHSRSRTFKMITHMSGLAARARKEVGGVFFFLSSFFFLLAAPHRSANFLLRRFCVSLSSVTLTRRAWSCCCCTGSQVYMPAPTANQRRSATLATASFSPPPVILARNKDRMRRRRRRLETNWKDLKWCALAVFKLIQE